MHSRPLRPELFPRWAPWPVAWALASALLLVLEAPTLNDPYWWDGIGCYFAEAWQLANNLQHYLTHRPEYVRAPLLCTVLALALRFLGNAHWVQHGIVVVVSALALPVSYALVRQLGGGARAAIIAAALCLATPLYFAQAGLIQMDVPSASLAGLAWLCALRGRVGGFIVFASMAILIKESNYYLCLPAAVLWWARLVQEQGRRPWALSTLVRLVPAATPGLVLALWLVVHRHITGHFMSSDHTVALGRPDAFAGAFLHNFLEGGRWLLAIPAFALLALIWKRRPGPDSDAQPARYDRLGVLATGLVWIALPCCFPGSLARYMAPSLPALCALAALGLEQLPRTRQLGAATLLLFALILQWRGDSWHINVPYHLDANLSYREMNEVHKQAAAALQAAGANTVLTEFPFSDILASPPEGGYVTRPMSTTRPSPSTPREVVCANEYFIEIDLTDPRIVENVRSHAHLELWRSFSPPGAGRGRLTPPWARRELFVRVYRIDCRR